jgi:hypothetical protein
MSVGKLQVADSMQAKDGKFTAYCCTSHSKEVRMSGNTPQSAAHELSPIGFIGPEGILLKVPHDFKEQSH